MGIHKQTKPKVKSQGKFDFRRGGAKAKYLLQKGEGLQAFKVKCCSFLWTDMEQMDVCQGKAPAP